MQVPLMDEVGREYVIKKFVPSAVDAYQDAQVTLRERHILLKWLIEIHQEYEDFSVSTICLACDLIDRCVQLMKGIIQRTNFQLLGITCFWIANKFYDNVHLHLKHLDSYCIGTYPLEKYVMMEALVLKTLQFELVGNGIIEHMAQMENCFFSEMCVSKLLATLTDMRLDRYEKIDIARFLCHKRDREV